MTYQFVFTDCLANYNSAALAAEKYTSIGGAGTFSTATNGIGFKVDAPLAWLKTIALSNGWIVNITTAFAATGGNVEFLRLVDQNGLLVIALTRQNTGLLRLDGASGFTTAMDTLTALGGGSTVHKIDLAFFYASSGGNGRVEVRANGNRIVALTSTAFTGGAIAGFSIGGGVLAPTTVIVRNSGGASITMEALGVQHDTAVWADLPTGGVPFIGNRSKWALFPNGDGTYAGGNWPVGAPGPGGSAVYQAINDPTADSDASYITNNTPPTSTNADRSSWAMTDLPANTTFISHVAHTMQVRSAPLAVTAKIKGFLDNSGTIGEGTEKTLLTTGLYTFEQDNYAVAPGGAAWTKALVNAVQPGVKLTGLA